MDSNVKLYKCYKGSCSKCLDEENPFITEDEYKALLDADGKIQCPEGQLECGIKEVNPADMPKPPANNKKLFIIIGISVFAIIIIVSSIFIFKGKGKRKNDEESAKTTQMQIVDSTNNSTQTQPVNNTPQTNSESTEPKGNSQPAPHAPSTNKDDQNSSTNKPASNNSLQANFNRLSDGSSYSAKDDLVAATLNLFTSRDAKVYTIGQNGTVVNDMSINDLLETMRTRNKHFVFIDGTFSDGKYSSIRVRAN